MARTEPPLPVDRLSTGLLFTDAEKSWLQAHPEIKIGIMDNWAPISFLNAADEPVGISADIAAAINRRLGGRIVLKPGLWSQLLTALKARQIDALVDFTPNPERKEFFIFTTPYITIPHAIIGKQGRNDFENETALENKILALEKGFGNVDYFRKLHPSISILEFPDTAAALDAVARGEADAYAGNRAVAIHLIREGVLANLKAYGRVNKPGSVLAIGVNKDQAVLQGILQKTLNDITEEEKIEILDKWVQPKKDTDNVHWSVSERHWLDSHPTLRIGVDPDWYPFEYLDDQGQYRGLVADYKSLLEKMLGIRMQPQHGLSWKQVMEKLADGDLDAAPGVTPSPDRHKHYLFTEPYVNTPLVVFTRLDAPDYSGLADLNGKVLAIVDDYVQEEYVRRDYPDVKLLETVSVDEGLKAVAKGRADAFLSNMFSATHSANRQSITNLRVNFDTEYRFSLAYAVRKDLPELVPLLDKALRAIDSESRHRIEERWLPIRLDSKDKREDGYGFAPKQLIVWFASFIAILLLLLAALRRYGRRLGGPFGKRSLLWHMGLVIVSAFLVLILIVAWFALERMERQLRREIGASLVSVNRTARNALELWLESQRREISRVAGDTRLLELTRSMLRLPRQTESLHPNNEFGNLSRDLLARTQRKETKAIYIVASDRTIIAASNGMEFGAADHLAAQLPEVFSRVFAGETVFVSPQRFGTEQTSAENKINEIPSVMYLIAPIIDDSDKAVAALVLELDSTIVFSRITRVARIQNTGETYAFDAHARLLTPSRFTQTVKDKISPFNESDLLLNQRISDPGGNLPDGFKPSTPRNQWHLTKMAASALSEGDGSDTDGYRGYRGVPVLGSWSWSEKLGIGLATEIDRDEALASYRSMRVLVLGALFGIISVTLALTALIVWLGERSRNSLELLVNKRTKELHISEERYALVVRGANDGVWNWDPNSGEVYYSPRYLQMIGYETEEFPYSFEQWRNHIHPDDLDKVLEAKKSCAKGDKDYFQLEYRMRHKDGHWVWILGRGANIKDEHGNVVHLAGTHTDISERKAAEEALRASEGRFRAMVENAMDAIFIFDKNGLFVDVNSQACRYTDYSREEMLSMHVQDLDSKAISTHLQKIWSDYGQLDNFNLESALTRKDGTVFPVEIRLSQYSKDDTDFIMASVRDITERKRVEQIVNAEREQ
ncbi:MAG: transporter substrate-binding domain-containing protein, partial [Gammaproteobacteria bacterium]